MGRQAAGIQGDGDRGLLTADDLDLGGPGRAGQGRRDDGLRLPRDPAQVAVGGRQGIGHAGDGAEGERLRQGLARPFGEWQLGESLVYRVQVVLGIRVHRKLDLHLGEALAGRTEDVLGMGEPVQRVGQGDREVPVDHGRVGARIAGHDVHRGEIDRWKELLVQPENAQHPRAHQDEPEEQHDRPVLEAPADDSSHAILLTSDIDGLSTNKPPV
jgi:hypothetical protein